MVKDDLIIWFESGKTCKFQDVKDLVYNMDSGDLTFNYVSVSDGIRRFGRFDSTMVAGYSSTLKEDFIGK